jgi:hypothetical protein
MLQALIAAILARINLQGEWNITTAELFSLAGADAAHFYRILYSLKNKIHYMDALVHFNQDTTGDLITLIEALTGQVSGANSPVEQAFVAAGLFLTHDQQVSLCESLISRVSALVASHPIDYEDATQMHIFKKNLWQTYLLYRDTYFSFPALIEATVDTFCVDGQVRRQTIQRYLGDLFRRHLLDWDKLFAPLYERMEKYFGAAPEETTIPADEPLEKAKKLFGISRQIPSLSALKKQYKQLMKMYHPDLNPAGLENAKSINIAYALLLANKLFIV